MSLLDVPANESYELRMANRLWGQNNYEFLRTYLETTRQNYGAEFAQVDVVNKTEQVWEDINGWVERQTNDKIKDLLPPGSLDLLTRLALTGMVLEMYHAGNVRPPE